MFANSKYHFASLLVVIGFVKIVTGIPGVITDLRISTTIQQRYAQTTVVSTLRNPDVKSSELKFKMTLPKTAFISSLIMQIDGKNYTSNVKEKGAAKKTYERAKKRGKSTGLVEQRDDTQQKFEVSTNVAAQGKVTFYLRYEELLRRFKGKYLYSVDIKPGHVVPIISIDVNIIENEAIRDLNVTELPGNAEEDEVSRYQPSVNEVHLSYSHRDTSGTTGSAEGLDGKFALTYDVDMHPDGGEVQVIGDFFVHHFSPEGLPKMPVHTVFVLDVSYSMDDGKLEQMKDATKAILQDIKMEDSFELIAFASDVFHLGTFTGRKKSLKKALKVVDNLTTIGSTNLNDAYIQAVTSIMEKNMTRVAKQIVFLTDGVATTGDTNKEIIRRNVREKNTEKHPIFGLAFGNDADFKLLKEVSADNRAFARKISFDSNAENQLKGFYEEIAVPLMAEVAINFNQPEVDQNSIVKQGTSNFYSGAEVVSAGQLLEGSTEVVPIVKGIGKNGPLQFRVQRVDIQSSEPSMERENFVARLWAYLTVQDLLERASVSEDPRQVEILKSKALETALRTFSRPPYPVPISGDSYDYDPFQTFGYPSYSVPISGESYDYEYALPLHTSSRPSYPGLYPVLISGGLHSSDSSARHRQSASYPRRSQSYVDNDPHFVVSVAGLPLPFCFDLHAHHGAILNLIKDISTDVSVNGRVTSSSGRPHLTYFTTLRIAFGGISLIVRPNRISVQCSESAGVQTSLWPFYNTKGKKRTSKGRRIQRAQHKRDSDKGTRCSRSSSWTGLAGKRFGDVMILLPKRKELHLVLGDGEAHFAVVRSKNKHNQHFLGFYMLDESLFSANTTGIIGQFSSKNVTAESLPYLMQAIYGNSSDPIDLSVYRKNQHKVYETSQVSGYLGHRRSMLDKRKVRCIFIRKSGRGLLDGTPSDYVVPCLSC